MWSEVVYLHSENSCFSTTKMETIPEKTKKSGKNPASYYLSYNFTLPFQCFGISQLHRKKTRLIYLVFLDYLSFRLILQK